MSNMTDIAVYDDESTPVLHTLTPESFNPQTGVGYFVERDTYSIADIVLSASNRKVGGGAYNGRVVLTVPIVVEETINGVVQPKLVRTIQWEAKCKAPADASEQELKNAQTMFGNLFTSGSAFIDGTYQGRTGVMP